MQENIIDKVFIIDDKYEEVLPVIQALAKKGIPTIYWNGNVDTKPEYPLSGIRLVILDMRFSFVTDSHTINTNLFNLLKNAISYENGPYILFIWSKHDNEYLEDFRADLRKESEIPQPYLIVNMEKNKFMKTISEKNEIYEEIASTLNTANNIEIKKEILDILENVGLSDSIERIKTKENAVEELMDTLDEKLKEANALYILLIWESLVRTSASKLVNDIASFSEFDETWDNNIKTLIQHLALANAGKALGETAKEYIINAMSSLNHMLPDELWNQIMGQHIDENNFSFINEPSIIKEIDNNIYSISKTNTKFIIKENNSDYTSFRSLSQINEGADKQLCEELYNLYLVFLANSNSKLLCEKVNSNCIKKPGGLYKIDNPEFSGELINSIFKNNANINTDNISLIKLDISSSCDYAQDKLKRIRILWGLMIDQSCFSYINNTEDIYCTPIIKTNDKIVKLVFNFHYISNESKDILEQSEKLFSFRELLLTEIKHKLSTYISRVGIINL